MKRNTPASHEKSPAPRTGTAAAGTATSSVVSHDGNSSSSRNSRSSSYRTSTPRNKKFSQGATRSRERLLRSPLMSNTAHTGTPSRYQPLVLAAVTATSRKTIVGPGPRPPTATQMGGALHPRPTPVHATPQSPSGLPRRACRCNPARPATPMIRDSFPQSAMVRPPSVAPGHCDHIASPLGSAPAPRGTPTVPTTSAGTSTGPRAHTTTPRTLPGPFHPPPYLGSGLQPGGTTTTTTGTRGARPSRPQRKQANPQRTRPLPARRSGRTRAQPRLTGTNTSHHTHTETDATMGPHAPQQGPSPAQPPPTTTHPRPATPNMRALPTSPAIPNGRYLARACKARPLTPPPPRAYAHTLHRGGGLQLGLATSDIPHAGWGVFALSPIAVGTTVLDYSGPGRSKEWVNDPQNDVRYVWADENDSESLATQGLAPIYIDANPAVSSSWGGRVNDGFHRGAQLRAERIPRTDRVRLVAIAPVAVGEELYLEYGPDYWQGHYDSLPPSVQAEARAHYDLTIIEGTCYTPDQRRCALREGLIHRVGKRWYRGQPPPRRPRPPPAPPALPRLPPPTTPTHWHGVTGRLQGEAPTLPPTPTARTPPGTPHNTAHPDWVPPATPGAPPIPRTEDPPPWQPPTRPPITPSRTDPHASPLGQPSAPPCPMLNTPPPPPDPTDEDTTPGPPPAAPPDGALPPQPTDHTDPDPVGTPPLSTPDGRPSPQGTRPLDWLRIRGSTISDGPTPTQRNRPSMPPSAPGPPPSALSTHLQPFPTPRWPSAYGGPRPAPRHLGSTREH